jgi:hypothetical protein
VPTLGDDSTVWRLFCTGTFCHPDVLISANLLIKLSIVNVFFFFTQQYRLFSNYSASLQEIYVVLIVHELLILLFGIGQLLFVKFRYVGAPPIPPQIGIIVRFDYVADVIGHGSQ